MNIKLLVPTYRARYLKVMETLEHESKRSQFEKVLNIGCGEGDYDRWIKRFCRKLYACDINKKDVDYCKMINCHQNIKYSVQNVENLNYDDNLFDFVLCIEVLEHVKHIEKAVQEINRVLQPGGGALITIPQHNFPFTYDPINFMLRLFNKKISFGAYGYGHDNLIQVDWIENIFKKNKLNLIEKKCTSKYLTGFFEMYWAGFAQKIVKSNAKNSSSTQGKKHFSLRLGHDVPFILKFLDRIINLDEALFKRSNRSIGLSYLVRKAHC